MGQIEESEPKVLLERLFYFSIQRFSDAKFKLRLVPDPSF